MNECSIEGCRGSVRARGWCTSHYTRWKRHGDPEGGGRSRSKVPKPCAVGLCTSNARSLGWCDRHYQAYLRSGDPLGTTEYTRRGAPLAERLASRIAKTDHCWFWLGGVNHEAYGVIVIDGRRKMAHRVVYEHYIGPISEDLVIDHLCRNHSCVRPEHLEPVTQQENVRRGLSMVRKTHCAKNHEFTDENTRWVRVCVKCSDKSTAEYKQRKKAQK